MGYFPRSVNWTRKHGEFGGGMCAEASLADVPYHVLNTNQLPHESIGVS
jgi:hypothetical protein